MTPTPLWKRLLILLVCVWGGLAAMPNAFYQRAETHNDAVAAIAKAKGVATPEQNADMALWPNWLPSAVMPLGLDLRGGAHLLARVEVSDVYKARMDSLWPEARDALRGLRDQVGAVRRAPSPEDTLRITITNAEGMPAALAALEKLTTPIMTLTGAGQNDLSITAEGNDIVIRLTDAEADDAGHGVRAVEHGADGALFQSFGFFIDPFHDADALLFISALCLCRRRP